MDEHALKKVIWKFDLKHGLNEVEIPDGCMKLLKVGTYNTLSKDNPMVIKKGAIWIMVEPFVQKLKKLSFECIWTGEVFEHHHAAMPMYIGTFNSDGMVEHVFQKVAGYPKIC